MLEKIRLRFLARTRYRGVIWLIRNYEPLWRVATPFQFLRYYQIGMEDGWLNFDIAIYRGTFFLQENLIMYQALIIQRQMLSDEEMVQKIIKWENEMI